MSKNVEDFWKVPIGNLRLQEPLLFLPETQLKAVVAQMQSLKRGFALIVDSERNLAGIITERDLISHFSDSGLDSEAAVKTLMTPAPITLSHKTPIAEAIESFGSQNFRHLPVLGQQGSVIGVLSIRKLVDYLAEHLPERVLNLPPDPDIIAHEKAGG
jgi:CBS domain-containing protein